MNNLKKSYLFLISQIFSVFGSGVVDYVLIWYITLKSGSGLILSFSLILTYLPKILGAYLVEKKLQLHRVKVILILSDFLIAIFSTILAVLIFFELDSYSILLSVMALRAVFSGIQNPCEKVLLAEITPENYLLKINGYNAVVSSLCSLAAPAIGAIMIVYFSMPVALMLDLVTAICAIFLLLFLEIHISKLDHSRDDVYEGLNDEIKKVFCWHAIVTFLIVPIAFLTPLLITEIYNNDVTKLAYNEIAYSLGSIFCGLYIDIIFLRIKGKFGIPSIAMSASICIITLAYCVRCFPVYFAIMFLASFFVNFFQIQIITILQKKTCHKNRTLIFSKMEIITNIVLPIGMLVWGSMSDYIAIEKSLIYSGLTLFLFSLVGKITLKVK